jgi:hypothetical protein
MMLTDTANFRSPHYHTAGDTVEHIDFAFLTAIVRALAGMVTGFVA